MWCLLSFSLNMASNSHCRITHDGALEAIQESPSPTESLRRRNHDRSSFDSLFSDDSSIFNAPRASLSAEEELDRNADSNNQPKEVLDNELAINMAMFISLAPAQTVSHVPWKTQSANGSAPKRPISPWRGLHLLSENLTPSKVNKTNTDLSLPSRLDGAGQRKTLSLNDVDNPSRQPGWPTNVISSASPMVPKYPPPVRVPTPPGLPSFGSPEAICYSAQFLSQPSPQDPPNEQRLRDTVNRIIPGRGGDSHSGRSYGDTLRRLFGFAHSPPPPAAPPTSPVIGRAEDGTVVQGRFPYRQSSHGMNLSRQLEDHPFHRRTLPSANTDGSFSPQLGLNPQVKDAFTPPSNPVPPRPIRQPGRLFASQLRFSPSTLPAVPQAAVTARPRTPPPAAILSLPRSFSPITGTRPMTGSQDHGDGVTDGPSDPPPMRSQEAVIETAPDTTPYTINKRSKGFWSSLCCSARRKPAAARETSTTAQPPTTATSSSYSEHETNTEGYVNIASSMEYPNFPPSDIESPPAVPSYVNVTSSMEYPSLSPLDIESRPPRYPGLWQDSAGPQLLDNLDGPRLGD